MTEQLVEWKTSRYLVLSTNFIVPTIFLTYYKHYYYHSVLLFLTVVSSINFWKDVRNGLRRDIDLVLSKISFLLYLYNGYLYLNGIGSLICWPNLYMIFYCFYMSNIMYKQTNENWLYYHFLFHVLVGGQAFIITCYLP